MDKIIILDFGSQYNQLIARRVREIGVYSEIKPFNVDIEELRDESIKGIIFSGGPSSVYEDKAPDLNKDIFDLNIPILGICYGMQITQKLLGGKISKSLKREYGKSVVNVLKSSLLTKDVNPSFIAWMSHGDHVESLAENFVLIGETESAIAIAEHESKQIYNLQFHPEVSHTEEGMKLLSNFILDICKCEKQWSLDNYIDKTIVDIKETVGDQKVILGLSGGVDSSVAAMLIHKAIGDQLTCIFIDTGLLRKNEGNQVIDTYEENYHMNIVRVDAKNEFFDNLRGVSDPEKKRKIIGNQFVRMFEQEKRKQKDAAFLAQGTIYPDVIESQSINGPSETIKSHHNVGGLPDDFDFDLLEPLRELFKDEVREVGIKLGIPKKMIMRHPFPGPGLGIRIMGEIDKEKVRLLQEADQIFIEELHKNNIYDEVSQAFVVLLPVKTVGVMGDKRTYEYVCALRSVNTNDFMTATASDLSHEFLTNVAGRIINEVVGINRVVYDITSKPPGTIEWE